MALPERPGGLGKYTGENGPSIMSNESIKKFGPPSEAGGFSGILARTVASLDENELGRTFGYRLPSETSADTSSYHGVFFAIPLTDLTDDTKFLPQDHSVLLIAPQETTVRMFRVRPLQHRLSRFSHPDPTDFVVRRNKDLITEFKSLFLGRSPQLDMAWRHDSHDAVDDFLREPAILSGAVDLIHEVVDDNSKVFLLQKALEIAEGMQLKRMAASDAVLEEVVFGEGDPTGLEKQFALDIKLAAMGSEAGAVLPGEEMSDAVLVSQLGDSVVQDLIAVNHTFAVSNAALEAEAERVRIEHDISQAAETERRHVVTREFRTRVLGMPIEDLNRAVDELDPTEWWK